MTFQKTNVQIVCHNNQRCRIVGEQCIIVQQQQQQQQ
jgi:hypothetical protein